MLGTNHATVQAKDENYEEVTEINGIYVAYTMITIVIVILFLSTLGCIAFVDGEDEEEEPPASAQEEIWQSKSSMLPGYHPASSGPGSARGVNTTVNGEVVPRCACWR